MNHPIRRVGVVACLMVAALLLNATYATFFRHDSLHSSEYNTRVRYDEFGRKRGAIIAGDQVIAMSEPSNDRLGQLRTYPEGALYAPITGYYAYNYGTAGLERSYNAYLAGSHPSQALDRFRDQVLGREPEGANVETTIQPKLQVAAREAMAKINATGAVVVMNPKTGAVLALYTNPSYDPNTLATHDLDAAKSAWERLNADPTRPTANRAVHEVYPPGSTFKMITSSAALENGMKPDTLVDTPSVMTLPGTNTKLINQSGACQDKLTLDMAFSLSCNTSFANVGMSLGQQKLGEQAKRFGFGRDLLPDLAGSPSRFPTGMDAAQLAQSSIGQFDVAATPLQMALVGAAIANDGTMMEPYLVQRVITPHGQTLQQHQTTELGRPISQQTARDLRQMMRNAVTRRTDTKLKSTIEFGGKSGTAETLPGKLPYSWYVALAPISDPHLVVAVFVEDCNLPDEDRDIGGSYVAGPVARDILEAAYR